MAYIDSFGVEHIPKEIKKIINNKNIIAKIFRLQEYDSILCGYFCIGFIGFMLKVKTSQTLLIFLQQIILKRMML